MAITTQPPLVTEQSSPAPTQPPRPRWSSRLGWVGVIAALATTAGLTIAVLHMDSASNDPNLHVNMSDAKDHPGYGPVHLPVTAPNLHVDMSDAKDHPRYNPPDVVGEVRGT